MIVPAKHSEIPQILSLVRACARFMISNHILQWNEHYPNQQVFEKDIERGELYLLKDNNHIIGTIVISTRMDDEYHDIAWLTPSKGNIYLHRLAVHPNHQGQGNARSLMDYAHAHAQAINAPSIRLDTFSQNKRNQRFYEARGYQKLGNIYFPKQSEDPFYCYERIL